MSCAACGVSFDENSDIVVCPECGAPHHRECWKAEGHCACEQEHSEQYVWEPAKVVIGGGRSECIPNETASLEEQSDPVICPMCGSETPSCEKYCERCGYDLEHGREGAYSDDIPSELAELFDFDEAELIEGVPAGDVKRFVGGMWIYYLPRFIRMIRTKTSVTFNFTAFLAHGLWFISRKMYAVGIPLMLLMIGISGYQTYFYSVFDDIGGRQKVVGYAIYMGVSALEGIIMILCGLFGNKFYMRYCTKKIKTINAKATVMNATAEQFNEAVKTAGGVAALQTVSVSICYLAVLYVLQSGRFF